MKVAIVGSQGYKHLQRVIDYVRSLPLDTIIVSGGAVGPDGHALRRGLPVLGLARRILVVRSRRPDRLLHPHQGHRCADLR